MQTQNTGNANASNKSVAIWLTTLLGFCVSLYLLYPGHYSFDSAYQYWEARTGEFSNITPVAMVGLWSVLLKFSGNPASLLCLNLAMFWAGLGLCFQSRALPAALAIGGIVVCGLSPLVLMQMAHLLSDTHMAALLVLATGLLASYRPGKSTAPVWIACTLIVYAGCVRQNALVAVIPFGAVAAWMLSSSSTRKARLVLFGAVVTIVITAAASICLDRSIAVERRTLWPMLAIWDLAAISVATGDLLLPPFTHGQGLSVEELRATRAFDPVSAAPLFSLSRSGIRSGFMRSYPVEQQVELAAAWWSGVRNHPREYLAHRLRTTALLLGRRDEKTSALSYYVERSNYRDNPALPESWNSSAHQGLVNLAGRLLPTWLFSALPYLLTHLTLLIIAWRRRREPRAALVLAVTSSALAYAASFVILAPSAELRFMTWPILSAPIVGLFLFAPLKFPINSLAAPANLDPV